MVGAGPADLLVDSESELRLELESDADEVLEVVSDEESELVELVLEVELELVADVVVWSLSSPLLDAGSMLWLWLAFGPSGRFWVMGAPCGDRFGG